MLAVSGMRRAIMRIHTRPHNDGKETNRTTDQKRAIRNGRILSRGGPSLRRKQPCALTREFDLSSLLLTVPFPFRRS